MADVRGEPGELTGRLLDVVDAPGPQLRAVATTLLIKALDLPEQEGPLIEAMIGSDGAAALIDRDAAVAADRFLRAGLAARLDHLAAANGEVTVVRALRDHLVVQVERWATRAVDDADNRRRAERFLAWADRPGQLEAAQRRGLFAGMDAAEFRRLADTRVGAPVSPETALDVWSQVDRWRRAVDAAVGEPALDAWAALATDPEPRAGGDQLK